MGSFFHAVAADPAAAIPHYVRALRLDPGHVPALNNLAYLRPVPAAQPPLRARPARRM